MAVQVTPGLKKAVLAGVFVGFLIAVMRYGVYHSVDITSFSPETFVMMTVLWIALDLFVVLAGLLCGYIMAATAPGAQPARAVLRDALLAGVVAGLINLFAMALIYYPQTPDRWNYDVLNLGLYALWYWVQIVVLSLAGGAIYLALIKRPRCFTFTGWLAGVEVGIIGAVILALAYYTQSLVLETYNGLQINGSYETLAIQFIVDTFVLVAGVAVGFATAMLIRRSVSSPAGLILSTALAGLIAGFFGILVDVLIGLGFPSRIFLWGFSGYGWLNIAMQIIYGAVLLMTMAIGGGVIYALLHGETKLLSAGPVEPEKQP
ncbi:MAG TPA: hypothetical protein VGJ92_02845 [Methanocella sp.]|jgi:hypothetical protein